MIIFTFVLGRIYDIFLQKKQFIGNLTVQLVAAFETFGVSFHVKFMTPVEFSMLIIDQYMLADIRIDN